MFLKNPSSKYRLKSEVEAKGLFNIHVGENFGIGCFDKMLEYYR